MILRRVLCILVLLQFVIFMGVAANGNTVLGPGTGPDPAGPVPPLPAAPPPSRGDSEDPNPECAGDSAETTCRTSTRASHGSGGGSGDTHQRGDTAQRPGTSN
ncbi:uncharacterized protein TM35_001471030, partial [Trypanosoma theileri]